jgi:hypothetical protein
MPQLLIAAARARMHACRHQFVNSYPAVSASEPRLDFTFYEFPLERFTEVVNGMLAQVEAFAKETGFRPGGGWPPPGGWLAAGWAPVMGLAETGQLEPRMQRRAGCCQATAPPGCTAAADAARPAPPARHGHVLCGEAGRQAVRLLRRPARHLLHDGPLL